MYRRGESVPAYSHIGLDTSATLNNQKHVCTKVKECIEESFDLAEANPPRQLEKKKSFLAGLFGGGGDKPRRGSR